MTDEEMTDAWVKDNSYPYNNCSNIQNKLKKAYLARLKADRPKWHNLRKDSNDLPESYMSVINQDGEKVMYDYSCEVWRTDDSNKYICETPIAWCEIPTYKEE